MAAKLNENQKRFCDLYVKCGSALQAAIEAGYSKNYAKAKSYKWLENDGIKSRIDKQLEKLESARLADADEVLKYLTSVMRGEHKEEVPMLCGDGCQELINKDVAAKDRLRAAELIGKRYGMFTDNVNLSGDVGVEIHNDIPKDKS